MIFCIEPNCILRRPSVYKTNVPFGQNEKQTKLTIIRLLMFTVTGLPIRELRNAPTIAYRTREIP